MSTVGALAAKEIRTLFTSTIAYAVIAVFIVLSGYTFTVSLFVSKQATLASSPRSGAAARSSCC